MSTASRVDAQGNPSGGHTDPRQWAPLVLEHHLRLMGWPVSKEPLLLVRPGAHEAARARARFGEGGVVLANLADRAFCSAFGVEHQTSRCGPPSVLYSSVDRDVTGMWRAIPWFRRSNKRRYLRTLHAMETYRSLAGEALLRDRDGEAVWYWLPVAKGGILFVGTDLPGDLVRYRQGDPAEAGRHGQRERWGYAGERPNYLFEPQRKGEARVARHADEWAWFAACTLAERTGTELQPVLPHGASGAVVLTGDDDQAALDFYRVQLAVIGDTPITYFLHPETKHTAETVRTMLSRPGIELGLHPDALEVPADYDQRFHQQAAWFRSLVGRRPRSVRNHGFLNRGYWGHLSAWLAEGVEISSNLPGLDGTVLNGSLLPARVVRDGTLTPHWSILTAVGDGILFVDKRSDAQVRERVAALGQSVRESGMPGVLVFNLHPENVQRARALHEAALELVEQGFLAWGLEQCLDWFRSRDEAHTGGPMGVEAHD